MRPLFTNMAKRHRWQWGSSLLTLVVLSAGWKFPVLGFLVPVAMIGGGISGPLAGRWFCGNICPRAGLLERMLLVISQGKAMPSWAKSMPVRIAFLLFLLVMLGSNVSQDPYNWRQWGYAFWLVCLVTSIIGVVMAYFWHPRSWCHVCPMGTGQNWLGGGRFSLSIGSESCRKCRSCEQHCPMQLTIIDPVDEAAQVIPSRDCIRCGECLAACPAKALHFVPGTGKGTSPQ